MKRREAGLVGDDRVIRPSVSTGQKSVSVSPRDEVGFEAFPAPVPKSVRGKMGPSPEFLRELRERLKRDKENRALVEGVLPGDGSRPGRKEGVLVSRATMEQYLRRGQALFDRWKVVTGQEQRADEELDPVQFTNWLLSLKPGLKPSSWRMYRTSAINFLEGFPSIEQSEAIRLLETDVSHSSSPAEVARRHREAMKGNPDEDEDEDDKTSAKKERRLPIDALNRIKERLKLGSRSRYAEILRDWLDAGILTGLRPIEWRAAEVEIKPIEVSEEYPHGRIALLYVISAKATNGRGTGVARTLDISNFSDAELAVVRRHAGVCRAMMRSDDFLRVKGQVGTLLRQTCAALWPSRDGKGAQEGRHYALYSCRHQAIANWKSMGLPLEEIAALVGHGVSDTTAERYGKRRSGWAREVIPTPPRAVPEEVTMVRQRMNMFQERLKRNRELGIPYKGPDEFMI
jgi:hypothetical protein